MQKKKKNPNSITSKSMWHTTDAQECKFKKKRNVNFFKKNYSWIIQTFSKHVLFICF